MARETETLLIEKNRSVELPDGTRVIYPNTNKLGDFQGSPADTRTSPSYLPVSWLNWVNRSLGKLLIKGGKRPSENLGPEALSESIQSLIDQAREEAERDAGGKVSKLKTALEASIEQSGQTARSAESDIKKQLTAAIAQAKREAKIEAKKESCPIGSIYVNYNNSRNPSSLLGFGTWTALPANYFLAQAGNRYSAGGTYLEGLPNITGHAGDTTVVERWNNIHQSGALYYDNNKRIHVNHFSDSYRQEHLAKFGTPGAINFNASRSSAIYGRASYVRPYTLGAYMWRRIA